MRYLIFIGIFSVLFSADITVKQGDSFLVTTSSKIKPSINFRYVDYPMYQVSGNLYRTVLGISYDVPVGAYRLKITGSSPRKYLVKVVSANFPVSVLTISEEKQKSGATDFNVLAQENGILGPLFKKQTSIKYWQSTFAPPLKNQPRITSPYGAQRFYRDINGKSISQWAHRGVDYGVPVGTPVYAPNAGKVLLISPFQVHGTTLVLDHGQGVVSAFNHLSGVVVTKNQFVKKGQLIAYTGNSGLTTGAHLHYGLSVNNVRVNPLQWFSRPF